MFIRYKTLYLAPITGGWRIENPGDIGVEEHDPKPLNLLITEDDNEAGRAKTEIRRNCPDL